MSLDHIIESFTVVWFSIRSTFITDVRACCTIKYVRMYVHEKGLCQSLSVMSTCEHSHLHPVFGVIGTLLACTGQLCQTLIVYIRAFCCIRVMRSDWLWPGSLGTRSLLLLLLSVFLLSCSILKQLLQAMSLYINCIHVLLLHKHVLHTISVI